MELIYRFISVYVSEDIEPVDPVGFTATIDLADVSCIVAETSDDAETTLCMVLLTRSGQRTTICWWDTTDEAEAARASAAMERISRALVRYHLNEDLRGTPDYVFPVRQALDIES